MKDIKARHQVCRSSHYNERYGLPAISSTSLHGLLVCIWKESLALLLALVILRFERLQARLKPSQAHSPSTSAPSYHLPSEKSSIQRQVDMIDEAVTRGDLEWDKAWNLRQKLIAKHEAS